MDKVRHHIIGTGRWGSWLARRLVETGFELVSVRNRTAASAAKLAKELDVKWSPNSFEKGIPFADGEVVWCCVQDDELGKLSESINHWSPNAQIVHCSGTSAMLAGKSTGVFWPIQSFTSTTAPDWNNLPIIVQASSPAFANTLMDIANSMSGLSPKLVKEDSDRMRLHLGAVMTQNFSNLLWRLTEEVLAKADNETDYSVLLPLAQNHLNKLANRSPAELQTGPASRGDDKTINSHLALLKEHPESQEIYSLLSELITRKEV